MKMDLLFSTYYKEGRDLCHLFKAGDLAAIKVMASRMATLVPSNVVLIPVPSRYGYATTTLLLANEIAKLTGSPVADILKGNSRQSNYISKKEGHPLSKEDLGFYKIEDTNLIPCFIDNVYDTGVTMQSAYNAFNRGIGLVYSVVA